MLSSTRRAENPRITQYFSANNYIFCIISWIYNLIDHHLFHANPMILLFIGIFLFAPAFQVDGGCEEQGLPPPLCGGRHPRGQARSEVQCRRPRKSLITDIVGFVG
jgi:hypothetical protein